MALALMATSAAIFFTIGTLHLIFTFYGPKLTPRDPALQISMRNTSPVITKETTMWRCWVGFNATHSMCLMLFGLIYGFLAVSHSGFLFSSSYLLIVGLLVVVGCVALSRAYFFSIPFVASGVSLACYVASVIVALA